jgi:hypothetical protein
MNEFAQTETRVLVMHATVHHEVRAVVPPHRPMSTAISECVRALDGVPNLDPASVMFYVEPPEELRVNGASMTPDRSVRHG